MSTATTTASTATTIITINRKAFAAAYSTASAYAPTKSPKPILESVKLTVGRHGEAELTATNLELSIRVRVEGVRTDEVGQPVEIVLPPKFGAILAASRDDEMTISLLADNKLRVAGSRSKFELPTEDPQLFPDVPTFPLDTARCIVDYLGLRCLIHRTAYACDVESTRYALGGALMAVNKDVGEFRETAVTFVATDGRRLAIQDITGTIDGPSETVDATDFALGTIVIPQQAMKLINKSLSDDPALFAEIAVVKTLLFVRTKTATIVSRLLEGRFPKYQAIFPDQPPVVRAKLKAGDFLRACRQAAIATSEESRGVDFVFMAGVQAGSIRLESHAADIGAGTVEVDAEYSGEGGGTVTLDPRYLIEFLGAIGDETEVRIEVVSRKHAVVLRTDDGHTHVVMPLAKE